MVRNSRLFAIGLLALGLMCCDSNQAPTPISNSNTANVASKTANANSDVNDDPKGEFMKSETGTEVATPKAGTANIQGKVFFNLMPVEGIEVMLCVDAANLYGDCIGKKLVTKTDANGQYLFADLEPRVYNALWVRVFKTQNYVHAAKYGFLSLKIKAEADKTFFVPLTSLFKTDLKVLQPKAKTNSLGEKFEIAWEAYPDAASYSLELMQFGGSVYHLKGERTKDTSYKFDKTLPDGHYRLRIEALNSSGIKLAQAGEGIEFFIKSSQ